jgi:pimeloyl-ACP methyl ester carboxylesterase
VKIATLTLVALASGQAESVRLDVHKVRYETAGPRHGTPVILIHGWACDSSFWSLQVPELAHRFRVLTIDLPGHGKSDKPLLDYEGPLFAKAVLAVMDAEKIDRAVLVGHSMGTEIAGRLLHEAPDRVVALVSLDGVVTRTFPARAKELGSSMRGPSGVEVRRKFIEQMFTPATPPDLRNEIVVKMLATPPYVAASAMEHSPRWDFRDRVTIPVLAINTSRNSERRRKIHEEVFADLEYVEIDQAGHFLHMEKPAEVNAKLMEFISKVAR